MNVNILSLEILNKFPNISIISTFSTKNIKLELGLEKMSQKVTNSRTSNYILINSNIDLAPHAFIIYHYDFNFDSQYYPLGISKKEKQLSDSGKPSMSACDKTISGHN